MSCSEAIMNFLSISNYTYSPDGLNIKIIPANYILPVIFVKSILENAIDQIIGPSSNDELLKGTKLTRTTSCNMNDMFDCNQAISFR